MSAVMTLKRENYPDPSEDPLKARMLNVAFETFEEYWGGKNLSINHMSHCLYNGPCDTHCAVGRCMLPELQETKDFDMSLSDSDVVALDEACKAGHQEKYKCLDDMLQPQYRDLPLALWSSLQCWHDNQSNHTYDYQHEAEMMIADILNGRMGEPE